jgi:hypothetical protein
LDPSGLINSILQAVVNLDNGRKGFAIYRETRGGSIRIISLIPEHDLLNAKRYSYVALYIIYFFLSHHSLISY